MTLLRMDNVLVVVEDLKSAIAFLRTSVWSSRARPTVEGPWIDSIIGFDGSQCDIAMMRTPDGDGRIELDKYHAPPTVRTEPKDAPVGVQSAQIVDLRAHELTPRLVQATAH